MLYFLFLQGMSASFKFKQFTIHHERTMMKVGTDGVLLGAWVDINKVKNILDIGTGSGVIALMLAQRSQDMALIDAVELDEDAFGQAFENVKQSPWPEKVNTHHCAIQNFNPEKKYDLIVSNPPYFQNSQKPPDPRRLTTRHTDALSFSELITAVTNLLSWDGKFSIILPFHEGLNFITLASQHRLYCSRQWSFRTRVGKPVERWLLEFRGTIHPKEEGEITLYSSGDEWSEKYIQLTKDFYLKY